MMALSVPLPYTIPCIDSVNLHHSGKMIIYLAFLQDKTLRAEQLKHNLGHKMSKLVKPHKNLARAILSEKQLFRSSYSYLLLHWKL